MIWTIARAKGSNLNFNILTRYFALHDQTTSYRVLERLLPRDESRAGPAIYFSQYGVYTQRYNWLKQTDGPLFRGRYKAILINAASYLLQVSRYIHRNPIELKTPLVAKLIDYAWSSYPAYLNKASIFPWLNQSDIFKELGTSNTVSA